MLAVSTGYYAVFGNAPIWVPILMLFCMVSAACSGVVCLVSAIFESVRRRRMLAVSVAPSPNNKRCIAAKRSEASNYAVG